MTKIKQVLAREVLDSRGDPTVEVELRCDNGDMGRAMVPAGASTGRHEAVELRDRDPQRYFGRGVRQAVENVHQIAKRITGLEVTDQAGLDRRLVELDGTPNKSHLGANALLGVSLACAHAAAITQTQPLYLYLNQLYTQLASQFATASRPDQATKPLLPVPMVNVISGGLHAGGNLDFQDFLIMPIAAPNYPEALHWVVRIYRTLKSVLADHHLQSALVGDEGGFGPKLASNRHAVELIVESIERAGYEPGRQVAIALDVASTHFYRNGRYRLAATQTDSITAPELVEQLADWCSRYPILSIEDGCAEDDQEGWRMLTQRLGDRIQLIGDDLFATNVHRLKSGVRDRLANAILVKPNQIGTLTETLEVIALAKASNYRTIVSARSGETEDTTIAHLAVGTAAGQIKIGSVARSERLAKYNELLRINEELGEGAAYAGSAGI